MNQPTGEMHGKVCIVTGATSGIGKVTAQALAQRGATVIVVARNQRRGEAAVNQIRANGGNPSVMLMLADLSSQASVRQLAQHFTQQYARLDVLVNNAGAFNMQRTLTVDRLETTFATNHLGAFLLTNLLLDRLKASAPSRIINVSSVASQSGKINFDGLQGEKSYSGPRAYSQSKLANILFTVALRQGGYRQSHLAKLMIRVESAGHASAQPPALQRRRTLDREDTRADSHFQIALISRARSAVRCKPVLAGAGLGVSTRLDRRLICPSQ